MNIAIAIHILLLIGVSAFVGVLFHYKKEYSFQQEHKQSITVLFGIIITLLMIISTIAFFRVPWHIIFSSFL
ncbi:MAG: hypothetical protein Q8O83_04405 [bacterium]|nr:hypothetical protein [bacterium]